MDEAEKSKRLTGEQQAFVLKNLRLTSFVCSHPKIRWVVRNYLTWDDAISQATVGLCDAARTWDGSTKFSHYAAVCIFRELVHGASRRINYQQKSGRREIVSFGYNGNGEVPDYRANSNPADKEWVGDTLNRVLRSLSPKYRETIRLLLANDLDHGTVGSQLGISRGAVSQRLREVRKKVRRIGITA